MIRVVHSGCRIRILIFYPSQIQGSRRHRIPDPDPQHWSPHANQLIVCEATNDVLLLLQVTDLDSGRNAKVVLKISAGNLDNQFRNGLPPPDVPSFAP